MITKNIITFIKKRFGNDKEYTVKNVKDELDKLLEKTGGKQ